MATRWHFPQKWLLGTLPTEEVVARALTTDDVVARGT